MSRWGAPNAATYRKWVYRERSPLRRAVKKFRWGTISGRIMYRPLMYKLAVTVSKCVVPIPMGASTTRAMYGPTVGPHRAMWSVSRAIRVGVAQCGMRSNKRATTCFRDPRM